MGSADEQTKEKGGRTLQAVADHKLSEKHKKPFHTGSTGSVEAAARKGNSAQTVISGYARLVCPICIWGTAASAEALWPAGLFHVMT